MRYPTCVTVLALATTLLAPLGAQSFRVVSSNIWLSATRGLDTRTSEILGFNVTWPGVKSFYRRTIGYGIIGMQEVDRLTTRAQDTDIPLDCANWMNQGWSHARLRWRHEFLPARKYGKGWYGNAAVTNIKIRRVQHWLFAFDPNNTDQYGKEQRGALAMRLDFPNGRRLWFVNTHLSYKKNAQVQQVWQMLGRIKTFDPDYPVIVVGDLNISSHPASPPSDNFKEMAGAFKLAGFKNVSKGLLTGIDKQTFVATSQLDYVFVYDPHKLLRLRGIDAVRVGTRRHLYADHMALVADFDWTVR